jgi:fatty acid desaturase
VPRLRRDVPPPLEGNDLVITLVGTAAWLVALVVLLSIGGALAPSSRWWIWSCAAGVGQGLFALVYVPRLKRSRAAAASRRAAQDS